ncbi:MAG: alpha/beta fold hydrolase [Gammaproteobacteria bacterium]
MSDQGKYYQSSDDLRLFYRDVGAGHTATPVLCLPGLTRNSRDFEDLAAYIAHSRRVVCPDFRGRGFSEHDSDWRNYHPHTYVNDIWRLLDHLGIERTIVVGTSLGGLCAVTMAGAHPERLAGVVMNDIGPEINPAGIARIQSYTGTQEDVASWDEAIAQAREAYEFGLPGLSDEFWARFVRRSYRENADGTPKLDMDPGIGTAVRKLGPVMADPWQLFDALADIPVTIIRGMLSDILTTDITDKMQARLPHIHVVHVPNRGHVPLLDEPESLTAIDNLLKDVA